MDRFIHALTDGDVTKEDAVERLPFRTCARNLAQKEEKKMYEARYIEANE
jgi:hypothetical protein